MASSTESPQRLVVIGGGPAGMSAASKARRTRPDMEISVFQSGRFVSFILCGIPYYISGLVAGYRDLIVYTPEFFKSKRNIDVYTGHNVTAIDAANRTVQVIDAGNRVQTHPFDKLVIAAGAQPSLGPFAGQEYKNVFTLRSLEEAILLKEFIQREGPRSAVIVGAGYIGMEMAESFRALGLGVTVIEATDNVMTGLDADMSAMLESELESHGVELHKLEMALGFESAVGNPDRAGAIATSRGVYEADLAIVAIGIHPSTRLAVEAGVAVGETGAIQTTSTQETNISGVYAAGDVAQTISLVTGKPAYVPLGTTANKQGRIAGENAAGGNAEFNGIVGSAAVKVFGLEVASTGLSEQQAGNAGFDARATTITHFSRSRFYPGAEPITCKMVADAKTGALLGAQMIGKDGVPKRVDVLAAALHAHMKVADLTQLDLTYSPPFAQSYDVVHIAAEQLLKKL